MKKVKFLVVTTALFFGLMSCKKDDVQEETKPTLELLTGTGSKTFYVSGAVAKQDGAEIDVLATQNPCVTDNRITLSKDFTYEFTEGALKCDPNDPDLILKANWSLAADEKSITIDKFFFLGYTVNQPTFKILSINESSFSGETTVAISEKTFDVKVTFSKVAP